MRKLSLLLVASGVLLLVGGDVWWLKAQAPNTPTIPAPILLPNVLTVNAPTRIVATVLITDPTLNPASVELYRINAGQSVLVGKMNDEGRDGDQKPGDRVFTITFTLNEGQVGLFGFQVSAAFRGLTSPRT